MLVRMDPFKEWVTIYFDPEKMTEEKLLELLHERRCKSSQLDRVDHQDFMAMNPFVSAGEIAQIRISQANRDALSKVTLPDGWKVVGDANGVSHKDGNIYLSLKVPEKAEQKRYSIEVTLADKKVIKTTVEVVRRIP